MCARSHTSGERICDGWAFRSASDSGASARSVRQRASSIAEAILVESSLV
jgi:hypothetical protein